MFLVTITSSIVLIILTVFVLSALMINNDTSEVTKHISNTLLINLAGMSIVTITYTLLSTACTFSDPNEVGSSAYKMYALLEAADLAVAPVCISFVKYIGALVYHKPNIEKLIQKSSIIMTVLGSIMSAMVVLYIVLTFMGINSTAMECVLYTTVLLVTGSFMLIIAKVTWAAREEVGKAKYYALTLYILLETFAIAMLFINDESIFFTIGAAVFIFLLIAMQREQIDMTTVESVRNALSRAEALNEKLESSMQELQRESFLLRELSDIYESLHIIDLKNDTFREIGSVPEKASAIIRGVLAKAGNQKLIWAVMKRVNNKAFIDDAITFTDFSTLNDRMKGRKSISFESIDDEDQWFRFSFIRIGGTVDDDLEEVIFASENIDAYRREKEQLERASYVDMLTGAYNRNAYIERCDEYRKTGVKEDMCIMVVDINDLKTTNDKKGHDAGDELIKGTVSVVSKAVGDNGRVYRIGGDEFVCIVNAEKSEFERITAYMEEIRRSWKGEFSDELYFSTGTAVSSENAWMSFDQLQKLADTRMYLNKKQFYIEHSDMERRQHDVL